MNVVCLTRRNLLALLAKLDRNKNAGPQSSECTIVKLDTAHPHYPCSAPTIVQAVEDDEYYKDRPAGEMSPEDEKNLPKPSTGIKPY